MILPKPNSPPGFALSAIPLILLLILCGACTTTVSPATQSKFPEGFSINESSEGPNRSGKLADMPLDELIRNGNLYLGKGNLPLAKLHYAMALKRNPEDTPAYVGLGKILYLQSKKDAALDAFSLAAEMDPTNLQALMELAKIHRERGNFKEAVEFFQTALNLHPSHPEVLTELAITYDVIGPEDMAEPLFQKVMAIEPRQAASYNNLGFNYLLQGRYEEAISILFKALTLEPDNNRAKNNLAAAYALSGNEERALELFEKTVGKAAAYNNLGYLLMTRNMIGDAERAMKRALELKPVFFVKAKDNLDRLQNKRTLSTP